jgi:hypothetical protein
MPQMRAQNMRGELGESCWSNATHYGIVQQTFIIHGGSGEEKLVGKMPHYGILQ